MENTKLIYEQVLNQLRYLTDYRTKLLGYLLALNTALLTIIISSASNNILAFFLALVGAVGSYALISAEVRAVSNTSQCLDLLTKIEEKIHISKDWSIKELFLHGKANEEFGETYYEHKGMSLLALHRGIGSVSVLSWFFFAFYLFMSNRQVFI